jgi:TPR repeat protein
MRELKYTLTLLLLAIAFGHAGTALAQHSGGKLSVELDSKTLSVQAKAEELFEREDYRRAHIIYLKDLAPIGDKYAQYMLGFMTASGLGVEQDASTRSTGSVRTGFISIFAESTAILRSACARRATNSTG